MFFSTYLGLLLIAVYFYKAKDILVLDYLYKSKYTIYNLTFINSLLVNKFNIEKPIIIEASEAIQRFF